MMKKVLIAIGLVILNLIALVVTFVGPWPTYACPDVTRKPYYAGAVEGMRRVVADRAGKEGSGLLQAGWAKASITPEAGVPLAGFGERDGRPSTGVHDEVFVKALALSDGTDVCVLAGADMLIIPENVADGVRAAVAEKTPLTAHDIYFGASHTHSSLGGWGPGLLAKSFSGTYDPAIVDFLIDRFAAAIVDAYESMKPASCAFGSIDAPDLIRNRTREAPTDSELSYLVVEQRDGARCYLASFSAHATVLGGKNMLFSGDYPGALQRAIEDRTGGFAMYLGGAVGSMSSRAPEGQDGFERAEKLGTVLAERLLEDAANAQFQTEADIESLGILLDLPPSQLRLNTYLRISPFFLRFAGIDSDGWIHCFRMNSLMLCGMPADFSGEISVELKGWASAHGVDLWVTSFNGDYAGYVSPDRYYTTADPEEEGYEMYLMSWTGPAQEVYFSGLCKTAVELLAPAPVLVSGRL